MSTRKADPGLEAVAIVGMSCRFPGAAGVEELWSNLRNGVESVRFFDRRELEEAGVSPSMLDDPAFVPAQAVLDGTDLFDAGFFGFTPRVAEATDPQYRLFLECSWEGLERAGYDPAAYRGSIGLFAGVSMNTYLLSRAGQQEQLLSTVGGQQAAIGNRTDHLTTMVAYKLDLRGPAVTVQTTCSTSLVAVHLACQSLLNYQCHMALAGGVRVVVPQATGYVYRPGGIHSPDGHCRPFDAGAQGTLTGSGVGVVVLKRLADAIKDGDEIHAVIRGTAINNDGAVKAGYTAPSVEGQAKVIATAQAVAGVHPEEIGYVEAHGTATPLGDPIELAALTRVFRAKTARRGFCALGAVKSNFGHLDTAAGMAGLIKAALALKHGQIPPTLHFERPNPELRLEESPFYVPTALTEWRPESGLRRAGVSAFGIGGTNAHVVLEEAPPTAPSGPSRAVQLLLLSARTASALEAATDNLRRHLETETSQPLADVAYTLRVGRRPFEIRRAVICHDRAEAAELLGSLHPGRVHTSLQEPRQRPLTFLFPGQGAQRPGMGTELYRNEEVFRREVDRCCDLLAPRLGLDLRRELLAPEEESRLDETFLTQPALFVFEYALARLWMEWGITPQAMIGHSLGEYVAACLAGVFSLESALALVAERGRLMQELPPGAMLSVQLPEEELRQHLGASLSLAAVNRPSLCVVSGPVEEIDRLERELSAREVACRRLRTSRAFHSALVEPILARFAEQLARVELKAPAIPFLSNLTGRWIRLEEATDPGYWVRHLRSTVRFGDGVEELLRQGEGVLLEVGPGRTLSTFVRQHPAWTVDHVVLASLHGRQQDSEPAALLTTLGRLWVAGTPVDWSAFHAGERRRRVALPTYPFERRRYWLDAKTGSDGIPLALQGAWKKDPADWFWVPSWRRTVPPALLSREPLGPNGRWLVLADEAGLGDAISARLEQLGQEVIRVAAGDSFARHPAGYALAPGRSEDYRTLIDDLRRSGRMPQRILHLWNVDAAEGGSPDVPGRALERGFFSLLFLAQALGIGEGEPPLRVDVVSTGMQEVTGGDLRAPEKAALLGPCKVLPKEYPNLRCRSIDLTGPAEVEPLLAELLAGVSEAIVAHRSGHRWVPSYEPIRLERPAEGTGLRQGGVYLVTGGFGGMGSTLSEHLARTCSAKLVLTGRSPLPPREEWDGWLATRGEDDPASRRIRQVQALEAQGAEVLAAAVDVTDLEGMRGVLAEVRRRFGPVHGVFHTAAVSPGGLAQLKTAEAASRILAPKLEGTRVLAALLAGEDLDFFLLCSSRSAIFGPPGGIDYTAANAFLDAFAHTARAAGLTRAVSINWCGWDEVGMMAEAVRDRRGRTAAEEGEPLAHPLLDRRRAEPGREAYLAEFSARTRWAVNEHRIAGNPVVPGTTYLEMARAAAAHHGLERIEIRDVFFLSPLRLREDESRSVRLALEETDGRLEFQVASRPPGSAGDWQKHVLGRVEPLAAGEPERRDVAAIRQRCAVREVTVLREEQSEDLGPRWQNVTRVHVGDGEVLAVLELPEAFSGDLASCALHPALLDRAASIGEGYLGESGGYLPFSYRSLKLFAPLPRRLYSHARLTRQEQSRGETISFDVDLLDESGNLLVEIQSYHKKRINDAAERLRLPEAAVAPPRASLADDFGDPEGTAEPAARMGISPQEGIDVFRRILAHPWAPQIVVSPNNLLEAIAALESHRSPALDRKAEDTAPQAGPRHDRPELTSAYAPPETELQARLAEIWQELLGYRDIGIHDNFFELGGDSVLAIQILARARKIEIEISPGEIFEHQTIAELAAHLERNGAQTEGRELPAPPIVTVPRAGHLPLSFAQERLWFLAQLDPDSPTYNMPTAVRMTGRLDLAALAASLQEIVGRHEVLRTRFTEAEGRPVQIVEPSGVPELALVDLSEVAEERREPVLRALIAEQTARPFAMTRLPLLRMTLFRLGREEHLALTVLHHAVGDGWSLGLFLYEFEQHYAARTTGRPPRLRDLPVQYADYAVWQRSWLSGEVLERKLAFWRRHLADVPPLLDLADRPRPQRKGFRAGTCAFRIPADLAGDFAALGRRRDATLFMALLAVFQTLLSRYSGREELVVGTPVSNRDRPEIEGLIGMFVNTLALRADLSGDPTFLGLLERIRRQMPEVYANQDLPFEKLVDALDLPRSLSHAPLLQVMLVLRNYAAVEHVTLEGLAFESVLAEAPGTQFDLSLAAGGGGEDELRFLLEYDRDLFDSATAQRIAGHFVELVRGVAADPDRRLSELPLLTAAERAELAAWNETSAELPDVCVHELIAGQTERTPDAVAVVCEGRSLTYKQLKTRAYALAGHLARLGVGPETLVGICAERSLEMVVGVLGILKSGGAFVPLDPAYPSDRLALMLEDAAVPVLLTQHRLLERLPAHGAVTVLLDGEVPPAAPLRPAGPLDPGLAAYVIFTSGSTGRPKGSVNSHRALVNRILWIQSGDGLTAADRALHKAPFGFDLAAWEILWPLAVGARLVIARPGGDQDPAYLVETIQQEGVTTLHYVPSMLQVFMEQPGVERCASLRRIIAGGEALPPDLAGRIFARFAPGFRLYNHYGPTETAVAVTEHVCRPGEERLPIGQPVANTQAHIFDRQGHPVPVSAAGELHIGGAQVGRGYLRRPDLTAERFVPDPCGAPGARLYRTGDLARRLPEGEIEYLGRIDHQVKIRGFRIELGEIEAVLAGYPGVREAVVIPWEAGGRGRQLAAYLGCDPGTAPAPAELRAYLKGKLPDYMIPASFIPLAVLPQNANGKLDRAALPAPQLAAALEGRVLPRTPLEEVLSGILAEVLELDEVGALDDFFDLGGNSLLALKVLSLVRETFGVEVAVARLFEAPTVAGLAAYLTEEPERRQRIDAVMPVLLEMASDASEVVTS